MIFLGVDGGQSSTTAWIGDETGALLGTGIAGPCNHVGVVEGPAKFKKVIQECLTNSGFNPSLIKFESACLGMSGGPADKEKLLSEILFTKKLIVTTDAAIALTGALGGQPGVVTIAGTGSIAFGINAEGKRARAGGWGYIFGDEGSAFDIVRQALRAVLQYEEGWGPPTSLSAMFQPDALHAFYTDHWPRSKVAALAPIVDQIANQGDVIAIEVLHSAALALATIALAVQNQLFSSANHSYIGGAFRSQLLLTHFSDLLGKNGATVTAPLLSAPGGALIEAYKAAGITPNLDKLLR